MNPLKTYCVGWLIFEIIRRLNLKMIIICGYSATMVKLNEIIRSLKCCVFYDNFLTALGSFIPQGPEPEFSQVCQSDPLAPLRFSTI